MISVAQRSGVNEEITMVLCGWRLIQLATPFVIRLLHPGFSLVLAKHCDLILSDFFCVDFVPLPPKLISLTYMIYLQRQRHNGGSELLVFFLRRNTRAWYTQWLKCSICRLLPKFKGQFSPLITVITLANYSTCLSLACFHLKWVF